MQPSGRFRLVVLVTIALVGCGDGSPTSTEPVVRFIADELNATAARGANALVPVVVTQTGGNPGTVRLDVSGLPQGVSATFPRDVVSGVRDSTRLALEVDTLAAPGIYNAAVVARRDGDEVARVKVRIVIPEPIMDIVLSSTYAQVSRQATLAVTATMVRANGFRGPITLSIEDAPAGAYVIWFPARSARYTVLPGLVAATLNATAFAPIHVGLHTVRIRAESPGMPTRVHQLQIQVTDP